MDRNRQINFLLRLAVTAAGLVLFWLFFRYALFWLLPFLIALGLSGLMEPWVLWCRKKLGFRRSFTSAVLTLLLASALVFGVFWLLSRLFQEAYALLDQLPALLGGLPGLVDRVQQRAQSLCAACPRELQLWVERLSDTLAQQGAEAAGDFSARMLGEMTAFATQLPSIGLFLITTVLAIYYTSSRYPDIRSFLLCQLPQRLRQPALGMRRNINGTLGRWCKAQLLLTLLTFSELLIGFFLLGTDYALLLAFLIALVDALPILGAGTALVPWAIVCLLADDIPRGIGLLALYAVISLVRSLMEPKLMADQAGLPPLCSLLAMYLGYSSMGLLGMILFPLLLLLVKRLHDAGYLTLWRSPE